MVRPVRFLAPVLLIALAACGDAPAGPPAPPPPPPPVSRPAFTITSPARASMLKTGGIEPADVTIIGQVCDQHYPITSLTIGGTVVPVSGSALCESFNVPQPSPWGLTIVRGEARNSQGKVTHLAQSFLRGFEYFPAAVVDTPDARVPRGMSLVFSPTLLDDGNRTTPNDIATLASRVVTATDLNAAIPNPMAVTPDANHDGNIDTWTYDCPLQQRTNRQTGYRVSHGVLNQGTVAIGLAIAPGQGLIVTIRSDNVSLPLTVRGQLDLGCLGELGATVTGTLTASRVTYTWTVRPTVSALGEVSFVSLDEDVQTTNLLLNVDFTDIGFLDNLLSDINIRTRDAFRDAMLNALLNLLRPQIDELLRGLIPAPQSQLVPGASVVAHPDAFNFTSTAMTLGLWSQATPAEVRAGLAPARGALRLNGDPPVFQAATSFDLGIAIKDDFVNQLLWSEWQFGAFDLPSLAALPCGTQLPGAELSSFAELPPVLMSGGSGVQTVSIGIGDLRLSGTVNGHEVTLYASGIVTGTLGVTTANLISIGSETDLDVAVQVAAIDDTSAAEAVRAAVQPYLECATRQLVNTALIAIPLLEVPVPAVPGLPSGTVWVPQDATIAREFSYTTVRGTVP